MHPQVKRRGRPLHQSRNEWIGDVFNTNSRLVLCLLTFSSFADRAGRGTGSVLQGFGFPAPDSFTVLRTSSPPSNDSTSLMFFFSTFQHIAFMGSRPPPLQYWQGQGKKSDLGLPGGESCLSRLPRFAKVVTGRKVLKQEAKTVSLQ